MCRLVDELMTRTQELLQPNPGTYIIHVYTFSIKKACRLLNDIAQNYNDRF